MPFCNKVSEDFKWPICNLYKVYVLHSVMDLKVFLYFLKEARYLHCIHNKIIKYKVNSVLIYAVLMYIRGKIITEFFPQKIFLYFFSV